MNARMVRSTWLKTVIDGEENKRFNIFGVLTPPSKIGDFYFLMQRTHLMILIELEYCGRFSMYGRLEIILFLISIISIP